MHDFGSEMGQKSSKGKVSITNFQGRIRLRWRYQGKRYSINLSYWNDINLFPARRLALLIEQDIATENFDTSLAKYGVGIRKVPKATSPVPQSFVELFEAWVVEYKQMDCDVHTNYNATRNMIRKWGKVKPENILAKLNAETFCPATYNRRLGILKGFLECLVSRNIWKINPLQQVSIRRAKKHSQPQREPFTPEEISLILDAFQNNTYCAPFATVKHSHYYPFLYFLFKTGVRNAEAIGLRVGSVDFKNKLIHISEVMARSLRSSAAASRIRKETKNGKVRVLPMTDDLEAVLISLTRGKDSDALVFQSPTGKCIDDHNFQNRIFKKVLSDLGLKQKVLYACRHTFGSRCIDQGITPVMTAFLMGNNPETALRNYVHQINIPRELPKI